MEAGCPRERDAPGPRHFGSRGVETHRRVAAGTLSHASRSSEHFIGLLGNGMD